MRIEMRFISDVFSIERASLILFRLAREASGRAASAGGSDQVSDDEREIEVANSGDRVVVSNDTAHAEIAREGELRGVLREIRLRDTVGHIEEIETAVFGHDFTRTEIRAGAARIDLSSFRPVSIKVPVRSDGAQQVVTISGDPDYGSIEIPSRAGVASALLPPGEYSCYLLGFGRRKFRLQEGDTATTVVEFDTP